MKILYKALVLAVMTAVPVSAFAEAFSATIAAGHPPVFRWVKMVDEAFIPAVNANLENTGYSINFTSQYSGSIANVGEILETVGAGLAELGVCLSLFDSAKMAPQNVTYYTPFINDNVRQVSDLMHRLQLENPRMQPSYEDNNVVYIGAPVVIDDYMLMTKFAVNTLADLEGKKIGAPGAAMNWLSGTGAVSVSGNLTTYYNELKTGVFDGVIIFASAALPSKIHELAPYVTRVGLGTQYAGSLCANKTWWDGLPEEVRKAMLDASGKTSQWYIASLEDAVENAFKKMQEAGATINIASDEMRKTWVDGMENSARIWARDVPGGSELLSIYMDNMRGMGAVPLRDWDKE